MQIYKTAVFRLLVALLLVGSVLPIFETGQAAGDDAMIIDHTCTDITLIPESAIVAAKAGLHIGYGHTSHGEQVEKGMKYLVAFANGGGLGLSLPTDIFKYSNGDTGGVMLDLEEGSGTVEGWLAGTCGTELPDGSPQFVYETHEYLGPSDNRNTEHADVNVIMWSWCREVDIKYRANEIESEYLTPMSELEAEYPTIKFVYMTGTLSVPHSHNQYENPYTYEDILAANQMIRDYCIANGKILYDFADIESWDPVRDHPEPYVRYEFADEACNYYEDAEKTTPPTGNWAQEWQDDHTQGPPGGEWYDCCSSAEHTQDLNGNLKAYAAWWLFARLAGWTGPPAEYISITITDAGVAGVNFGSLDPGTNDNPDLDSNISTPSIIISVDSGTTVPVDLQIKGIDFSGTFTIDYAKYSTTYGGEKKVMSATYDTFAFGFTEGQNAEIWHWLDVPSSGVTAGDYTSTFSYKAIPQ